MLHNCLVFLWFILSGGYLRAKLQHIRWTASQLINMLPGGVLGAHQKRLGDDVLNYFQVVLHGFVFGVGPFHFLISEETKQQGLILEFTLF